VVLDPGMIFGTGAHASTQMCLKALEQHISGGERVIDLGSGSGILSIAALLLGADTAVGVDIDPKAEDIARENAALNGLTAPRFQAVTGNVIGDKAMMEQLSEQPYDVVLANIVADVIIPLSPVVPHFMKADGIFICSGVLNTRLSEVQAALAKAGLTVVAQWEENDWCCLAARLK
jgi:ribosomal protein L11 methyltransferase